MTSLPIQQMTWDEKLQAMEELWVALSQDEARITSPGWHEAELRKTIDRYRAGEERPIDWPEARRDLLKFAE